MPRLIDLSPETTIPDSAIVLVSIGGIAKKTTAGAIRAGALQVTNNLADLNDAPSARSNLGLGDVAVLNVGAGLTVSGDDLEVDGSALVGGTLSDYLGFTGAFTITASGTDQAGATLLAAQFNVVTTAAGTSPNFNGVRLPDGLTRVPLWIRNSGANPIKLWPDSGAKINALSTDAAAQLSANAAVLVIPASATQWYTF